MLLLHRHLAHADVVAGLEAAVSVGATTAEVVAIEARRAHDKRAEGQLAPAPPLPPARAERVVSLTERRLVNARDELPADTRSLPTVEHYDELLTRGRCDTETGTQ